MKFMFVIMEACPQPSSVTFSICFPVYVIDAGIIPVGPRATEPEYSVGNHIAIINPIAIIRVFIKHNVIVGLKRYVFLTLFFIDTMYPGIANGLISKGGIGRG